MQQEQCSCKGAGLLHHLTEAVRESTELPKKTFEKRKAAFPVKPKNTCCLGFCTLLSRPYSVRFSIEVSSDSPQASTCLPNKEECGAWKLLPLFTIQRWCSLCWWRRIGILSIIGRIICVETRTKRCAVFLRYSSCEQQQCCCQEPLPQSAP